MRLMAAGLLKELVIEFFDNRALMRFSQREVFVLLVKRLRALGFQVGKVAHAAGLDGFRVNATPVPEVSPMLPKTIV